MFIGLISLALVAFATAMTPTAGSTEEELRAKATVVLVHGAFADSSSWDGVTPQLQAQGHRVVAAANPLRSVKADAGQIAALLNSISGPIVLVGHSYGGMVISNAAEGNENVKALVYVGAYAPEPGESAQILSSRFPGSTLGQALAPPVLLPGGGNDLYLDQAKFHQQLAADVPGAQAALMAAGQSPITEAALNEGSQSAAWKAIPSRFVYGTADRNVPAQAHAFMAKRANSVETVAVEGASHVVMVSHPDQVAQVILNAASA
jgi:pimeloyl-ACP methyl ester carboxylesterase